MDQKNQGRARVKIAVFFVLAVHGIGLLALLISGCRREDAPNTSTDLVPAVTNEAIAPVFEATNPPVAQTDPLVPSPDTNVATAPVTPTLDTPVTPATTSATTYKVAKGDTFSGIAGKFHVTVRALVDANPGVEPTKLQIDQTIQIPAPAPAITSTTPAAPTAPDGMVIYKVKSGDTLSSIASRHGTTIRAIRAANNLRTDRILVGQELKIPAKSGANGTSQP